MYKIFIAILAICILVGAYFFFTHTSAPAIATARPTVAIYTPPTRTAPSGMKEYRDEQYRFSLFIPDDMVVSRRTEEQGAATITFEDMSNARGFEIFIVPYLDPQVSEERFREDIPSGVRTDTRDVSIDGAVGATFHAVHDAIGETSEIWFIRDGYLYEVMTPRSSESWLATVMQTWDFL